MFLQFARNAGISLGIIDPRSRDVDRLLDVWDEVEADRRAIAQDPDVLARQDAVAGRIMRVKDRQLTREDVAADLDHFTKG